MERDGKDFINQLSWEEENTTQELVAKETYHSTNYTPLGASPRPRRHLQGEAGVGDQLAEAPGAQGHKTGQHLHDLLAPSASPLASLVTPNTPGTWNMEPLFKCPRCLLHRLIN